MEVVRRAVLCCGLLFCGLMTANSATAQRIGDVSKSVDNLMVVLREWSGGNKQDETLKPVGKVWTSFDGENRTMEFAWYSFLGNMNVVFVFDGPHSFVHVTAEEFTRFHLSPEEAVERAIANIKRVYGAPHAIPYQTGIMQVVGASPDLDSSFFLDRAFWRGLLAQHPEGLVVGVPSRGGLVFAPATDDTAVATLRHGIVHLYRREEKLHISSALYLFKDDRWTVFQAPAMQ
jgi:uncharacterized protein YtpQ (UPF0354 family)